MRKRQPSISDRLAVPRRSAVIGLLLATLMLQPANSQIFGTKPREAEVNNVFLPAPRGLRQQLTRARRALQEERFGEAVDRLGQLLATPELTADGPNFAPDQDYFLSNGTKPGTQVSMKSEAEQLLGDMPPKGRDLYELKYGADAQRLLDEAPNNEPIRNWSKSLGGISTRTPVTPPRCWSVGSI